MFNRSINHSIKFFQKTFYFYYVCLIFLDYSLLDWAIGPPPGPRFITHSSTKGTRVPSTEYFWTIAQLRLYGNTLSFGYLLRLFFLHKNIIFISKNLKCHMYKIHFRPFWPVLQNKTRSHLHTLIHDMRKPVVKTGRDSYFCVCVVLYCTVKPSLYRE